MDAGPGGGCTRAMASMRFASVHMAGTSAGAGGGWYRAEDVGARHRDTGLGGGLVRRASWSWVEASRTFGRVREAACDR